MRYQVSVLNADGSLACALPPKNNLILDSGLDLVATRRWADMTSYAVVGTGTTPVKRDSGSITFSRSGSTVTASAGFFESNDVGRLLKFDSGEEMYITGFTDAQTVTVSVSGTLGASEGTIWYVNRTGLASESKRTNTYGGQSGDNGTSYAAGAFTFKRTYIFSAETGPVTYNEIGWSHTGTPGANLFGMDIISGGISLASGQQLKVIVELSLSLSPLTAQPYINVITGWSQDGDYGLESIPTATDVLALVGTDGAVYESTESVLDPGNSKSCTPCSDATAISAATQSNLTYAGAIGDLTLVPQTYITGSRSRDFSGTASTSQLNSTSIRSLVIRSSSQSRRIFRVLLDANETKDSDHTLTLAFRLTWGRILVN